MTFVNPIDQRRALASVCIIYTLLTTGYVPTDEDLSISLGHSNFSFLIRAQSRLLLETLQLVRHLFVFLPQDGTTHQMTYLPDKDSEVNTYVTETELKFHSVLTFSESRELLFDEGDYVYSYLKPMDKRSFFPHLATNNLQGRLTGFSCNATN